MNTKEKMERITRNNELVQAAMRFWREAEGPSETDMERLFWCLTERDLHGIEDLTKEYEA